ncbi:glycoside hydrolase family 108 protein [Achromobacter xylosoxidans]|uniref:glycoside hydrolase family 108 protein n=1 Tax=Alcaligenes xylosoxydans xylosoxydans TaxID=85698 RepID=UPI0012AA06B4|nr:glycosyl hydrolase 108 family protein [Achromobacter xylosoxidans]CUR70267.1 putative Peptidoglycan domain protein [Achromobacter xylosoxidans]
MTFDTAFDRLIGHEGGYSNHPDDPGGETMWGITAAVARANGYTGAMRELPRDFAKNIYRAQYWDKVRADSMPFSVAFQVFDAAVNHGTGQAAKFLQRAAGVTDDGVIGPKTLAAVAAVPAPALLMLFNAEREQFYTDLKTWPSFGKGWSRRVVTNLRYAAGDLS